MKSLNKMIFKKTNVSKYWTLENDSNPKNELKIVFQKLSF